jgi:hypothetical protein
MRDDDGPRLPAALMRPRGKTADSAADLAMLQVRLERERADRERREQERVRAMELKWEHYGPRGRGFVTTGLKGEE